MWQYSSSGQVAGIAGNVDMNIANKDYPTIIRGAGLNGFTKPTGGGDDGQSAKVQAAINTIQAKCGFEEQTIKYLLGYKYSEALLTKLAEAMT